MATELETKILAALQANPELEHDALQKTLSHGERIYLLDTVRDMEKRKLLRRDLTLEREGRRVLRYLRGTG